MKPIDGDALFCKFWSLADPYVKQKKVFPSQVWNQAATMVREAPYLHTTNEMLTLEEIERAYETPAWYQDLYRKTGYYVLIGEVGKTGLFLTDLDNTNEFYSTVDYGARWALYRRPPDGEEAQP